MKINNALHRNHHRYFFILLCVIFCIAFNTFSSMEKKKEKALSKFLKVHNHKADENVTKNNSNNDKTLVF